MVADPQRRSKSYRFSETFSVVTEQIFSRVGFPSLVVTIGTIYTLFCVRLPLLQSPHEPATREPREQPLLMFEPSPLAGVHILLVDDDPDALEFVTFSLEQSGAIVTAVHFASKALEVLPKFNPMR